MGSPQRHGQEVTTSFIDNQSGEKNLQLQGFLASFVLGSSYAGDYDSAAC